jgi:hypothetical protein
MKSIISLGNNLSRLLVALVATLACNAFHTAIARAETVTSESQEPPTAKTTITEIPQLIAQVWADFDLTELSLATPQENYPHTNNSTNKLLIAQILPQQQLIAQLWSDIPHQQLSLGILEPQPQAVSAEKLLIAQLRSPQSTLIAQLWTDVNLAELSLVVPQAKIEKAPAQGVLITQLLPQQQQLIAQLWSDIPHQELSFITLPKQEQGASTERLLITQLRSPKSTLIAQLWTDVNLTELSLATSQPASQNAPSASQEVFITQLLPQQQQLIAQLWSDIAHQQLSFADSSNDQSDRLNSSDNRSSNKSAQILITQLLPHQQEVIAEVWSDLHHQKLSLATVNQFPAIPPQTTQDLPVTKLINPPKPNLKQQQATKAWTDSKVQQLALAAPVDQFDQISALSSPFVEHTPAIPVPSKDEIAARIVLDKVQIITPAPGVVIDGQSDSSVTVQYPANTTVKLQVNGKEVDSALVTREQLDFNTNLVTQTWEGAKLKEGNNEVNIIASKGGFTKETKREVIVNSSSETTESPESSEPTESEIPIESTKTTPDPTSETAPASQPKSTITSPEYSEQQLVKILAPKPDAVLENISSSVVIQFPEEANVMLQVNGKSVNSTQAGRTEVDPVTKIVTQTWYGVIFGTGKNKLSVLATTDGKNYSETAIEVKVPGKPERLEISTVEAHIPADGKSVATVKGRFLDRQGEVSFWNEVITLNSSDGEFIGADFAPNRPGFQVRTNEGEFSASLQAGYDPGKVTIQAKASQIEAFTQIQLENTLREQPLLTGFASLRIGARGTDYYDSFRDFLPLDEDNDATIDFKSAAFITGSLGKWTYTGAYNSDRPLNEDSRGENRLFRTYSSGESNYPVYGDSSTTEVTTPSIDKVYFRLERNSKIEEAEPDYFMWGDYDTEEFASESQEFSAVTRQLHGFKSNYNLGDFQFNALYANNLEGFQRDAIAPDGTSGFYFLSRRLLIPGSEDIYLELSPLNDSGTVVKRERLSLGLDYEIDYDRGTLFFKDPVLRTQVDQQGNILTRRIVATYQFESEASESNLFAGRARYHFDRDFEHPSWLGSTYLNENREDQDFALFGLDTFISLGDWGSFSGEYANSQNQTIFANANGSAYRLEGKVSFSQNILGRAFYRRASSGFANNATLSFVPGQTRYGSELTAKVGSSTDLKFLYEHQENKGVAPRPLDQLEDFLDAGSDPVPGSQVDNSLATITAGVTQKIGEADLGVDLTYRDRQDNTLTGNLTSTSTQLRSHASIPIIDKLTFHALNDLTLSDDTDAVYSDRIGLGLDWEFYSGLSLVFNHQWFTRGNQEGNALTTLGLQGEYTPWANATMTGRLGITNGIAGIHNTGAIGLQQKVPITAGLDLNLDYERTFNDFGDDETGTQFLQPFSVGQGASALGIDSGSTYGIGIQYSDNPNFTADAKFQYSDGKDGSNTVLSAGATGKISSALTTLFSFNQASSANQKFDIGTTRKVRLGLAYRHPKQDKFNALLRYEYEENPGLIPETVFLGSGTGSRNHLFAGEVIYAPNWRWEFYGKLAFRNSRTFIANDFVNSSNISLGQLRATYRLNYHMDLVAEGRTIWQTTADYTESAFLLEAGYYLSPEFRIAAGYVFGSADDEDFTGTRSAGGPYLGMTVKLNGLLDGFGQHSPPKLPEGADSKGRSQTSQRLKPHAVRSQKF